MRRPNRLADVGIWLWIVLWGVIVFYVATALYDLQTKRSGQYDPYIEESQEVQNAN